MIYSSLGGGGGSSKLKTNVVESLPDTGVEGQIYLVADTGEESPNLFTEYVWVNNKWEKFGSKTLSLTDYYKKTESDAKYATKEALEDTDGRTWIVGSRLTSYATGSATQYMSDTGDVATATSDELNGWKYGVLTLKTNTYYSVKLVDEGLCPLNTAARFGVYSGGWTIYSDTSAIFKTGSTGSPFLRYNQISNYPEVYELAAVNSKVLSVSTSIGAISDVLDDINGETELENIDSTLDEILEA